MEPKSIREEVTRNGFAHLPEYMPTLTTLDAAKTVGTPVTLPGFPEVQSLRPKSPEEAKPNTYSGNYGRGEFPLHTDLAHWVVPPRYLMLRCVTPAEGVATRLVDGWQVVREIGETQMTRTLVRPRRPIENSLPLLRLLDSRDRAGRFIRWDGLFIVPAGSEYQERFEAVAAYLESVSAGEVSLGAKADVLVIDNWRMLHGRGKAGVGDRQIDRVYLDGLR